MILRLQHRLKHWISAACHPAIMRLLRVPAAAVAEVVDALSRGMSDQFSDLPLKGFI